MKKLSFVLFTTAIIMMAACSSQEFNDESPSSPPSSSICNKIRSYEDALKIAQASISMLNDSKSSTRGEINTRKIDLSNSKKVVKLDTKTRSDLGVNDTLIYVFNFENNEGFVLVSAYENTEALLAIAEQGNYDPDIKSRIGGFELFLNRAKQYVAFASKRYIEKRNCKGLLKDTIIHAYTTIGPYINVKWGQLFPEGEFCPNGVSGCTNTALAQIMTYYQYPLGMGLTYPNADVSYQNFNWTNMKNHNSQNLHDKNSASCNNINAHEAIGRLLRQLGYMNESTYVIVENPDSNYTSTNSYLHVGTTMGNLNYEVGTWQSYNGFTVRGLLDIQRLCFAKGNEHAWVIDGYKKDEITEYIMELIETSPRPLWSIVQQYDLGTFYYNHMNWGWNGDSNGYYAENVFNTSWPTSLDTGENDMIFSTIDVDIISIYL